MPLACGDQASGAAWMTLFPENIGECRPYNWIVMCYLKKTPDSSVQSYES